MIKKETLSLKKTIQQMEEKHGKGIVMKLDGSTRVKVDVIPTSSLNLNYALGVGGIPRGRVIEIFGPESSGKTTLALHIIAEAQKQKLVCAFIDAEHALDIDYAKKLGVQIEELYVSQPGSGEQALDVTEKFVKSNEVGLIVVDSVAALTPQAEIDGDMGARHIGLQARLMSQALRKLTAITSNAKTTIIFINQIRINIGQTWGCVHCNNNVHLASKKIIPINQIQKNQIIVSLDLKTNIFKKSKIKTVYVNGIAKKKDFLKIKFQSRDHNKYQIAILTKNHKVLTENNIWKEVQTLKTNDRLISYTENNISSEQEQIIIGSLFGDGEIRQRSFNTLSYSFTLRNSIQTEYLKWKIKNLNCFNFVNKNSTNYFSDWSSNLQFFYEAFYQNEYSDIIKKEKKKKYRSITKKMLDKADKLAFAVWFLDDGSSKYSYTSRHSFGASISFKRFGSVEKEIIPLIIDKMKELGWLGITYIKNKIKFDRKTFEKFCDDIKEYVIPEMQYKLLPEFQNKYKKYTFQKTKVAQKEKLYLKVIELTNISKKEAKSLKKYDLETDISSYMIGSSKKTNGIVVHNSPEVTTGGKALHFYASMRIEVRRAAKLTKGDEVIGNRIKVKIAKNKLAAPFKVTEFDILFNEGISKETDVLKFGLEHNILEKKGNTILFDNVKIGVGLEQVKNILRKDTELTQKIIDKIKENYVV